MWQAARAGFWIAVVLALAPPSAGADARVSKPVHVRIAATDAERAQLERVLIELMQRLSVELVVAEGPAPRAAASASETYVARAFIDLRGSSEAVLYVHDPARDRVLERRVARAPGGEELVREELGHMLLATVEALLAGAEVGSPRAELPEAASQVAPAPAPEDAPALATAAEPRAAVEPARESSMRSWRLRAAILYEIAALGHGPDVTHGPVVAADLRSPWPLQVGLLLSAQYRFAFEIEPDPIGMHSRVLALRALPAIAVALGRAFDLRIGLGGGADVTRLEPRTAGDDRFQTARRRTLALAVGRALVGVEARVAAALSLWAALAVDVDLDRSEYVLERDDGSEVAVTAPWRLRPAVWLGAALP